MRPCPEDFRAPDEVAGMPVGERDLASRRGRVEDPDAARLDQIDPFVRGALVEHRLAAIEHAAPAVTEHQFAFTRRERLQQGRRPADQGMALDQQERPGIPAAGCLRGRAAPAAAQARQAPVKRLIASCLLAVLASQQQEHKLCQFQSEF